MKLKHVPTVIKVSEAGRQNKIQLWGSNGCVIIHFKNNNLIICYCSVFPLIIPTTAAQHDLISSPNRSRQIKNCTTFWQFARQCRKVFDKWNHSHHLFPAFEEVDPCSLNCQIHAKLKWLPNQNVHLAERHFLRALAHIVCAGQGERRALITACHSELLSQGCTFCFLKNIH